MKIGKRCIKTIGQTLDFYRAKISIAYKHGEIEDALHYQDLMQGYIYALQDLGIDYENDIH